MNTMKVALPKGRLMTDTAALLERAGWGLSGYHEGTRSYRLKSAQFPGLLAKMFHEKDIPVQVAVGNYDLGICGRDWVEELLARYPGAALLKLKDLGYGQNALWAVSGAGTGLDALRERPEGVRLVSEYPNLAERLALEMRLKRFRVFPVWGAAEVYPPEDADLALLPGTSGRPAFNHELVPVRKLFDCGACLIANRERWSERDLSQALASIERALAGAVPAPVEPALQSVAAPVVPAGETARIALPDGHQQAPTVELLQKAGIRVDGYPSADGNRRPRVHMPGVTAKVIRPQDMPLQVANGNFDLAISGRDWLTEHRNQFPASPVVERQDLGYSKVRIVAVVCNDVPADGALSLRELWARRTEPVRIASEYVNVADKYARDNRLGRYRVIPTWGATEAFLPEDADLLIENTQTGRTIARHNLKIIDTLFESTACVIGRPEVSPAKRARVESIIAALRKAVEVSS